MKKKFLIATIVILVIIALVALGFIVGNMLQKEPKPNSPIENNANQVGDENNEQEPKEDEGVDVVLNSKIGTSVLSKFYMPNIYSEAFYHELDNNGLSNKAKLLYAYIQISKKDEYANLLRIKEDYSGSYITANDMETVVKKLFTNTEQIKHQEVFGTGSYNSEDKTYVIVPMGFAGNDMDYIVEIPYKITEYANKVEVEFYRIFGTNRLTEDNQQEQITANFYYDEQRTALAFTTMDEDAFDEDEQISYLTDKMNQGKINSSTLQKVKYTLLKTGNQYFIDQVEK